MIEIIPAILPKTFDDMRGDMALVDGLVPYVQIDVLDGVFLGNKTWPYSDQEHYDALIEQSEDFPFWDSLSIEADLMVADPLKVLPEWISFGSSRIVIHVESLPDVDAFFEEIKISVPSSDSFLHTEIGLAFNLETDTAILDTYRQSIDFVQCMGIDKIGYQGQVFDSRVIKKVQDIHKRFPDLPLSIDGGVSLETAPALISAGATRLIAGSAIFAHDDVEKIIQEFREIG